MLPNSTNLPKGSMHDKINKNDNQFTAIIMAGGKSSRFEFSKYNRLVYKNEILNSENANVAPKEIKEKTMIEIDGKPLIFHSINTLFHSKYIKKILIACSPSTKETENYIRKAKSLENYRNTNSIEILNTDGLNYHEDLRRIILNINRNDNIDSNSRYSNGNEYLLIISADIYGITPLFIEKITNYFLFITNHFNIPSMSITGLKNQWIKRKITPTYVMNMELNPNSFMNESKMKLFNKKFNNKKLINKKLINKKLINKKLINKKFSSRKFSSQHIENNKSIIPIYLTAKYDKNIDKFNNKNPKYYCNKEISNIIKQDMLNTLNSEIKSEFSISKSITLELVPMGITLINSRFFPKDPKISMDELYYVINDKEFFYNINTVEDFLRISNLQK